MDIMSFDTRVGVILRARRKMQKLTQDALSAIIGVTPQQIANYELGKSAIPLDMLAKIAEALGCGIIDLIPEDSNRSRLMFTDAAIGSAEPSDVVFLATVLQLCHKIHNKTTKQEVITYLRSRQDG